MGVPDTQDPSQSVITTPKQGAKLTGDSQEFTWTNGNNPQRIYDLHIGSAVGENDYYDTDGIGSANTTTATNLSTDGSVIYVRLYWTDDNWATMPFIDTTFTAAGSPPDPDAFQITSFSVPVGDIKRNSAIISWDTNQKAQGYVEYGTTTSYGSQNEAEISFDFDRHTQLLLGLSSETKYYYRIVSTNQAGEIVNKSGEFTTLAGGGTDPVTGFDESLPMLGAFYGSPVAVTKSPSNTVKKARHWIRFRAAKSDYIDRAYFDVRIGPGYSDGTGGVIKYVIVEDDGSDLHLPRVDGPVYGTSLETFVPGDFNKNIGYAKELEMSQDRPLVAGKKYHLGIINIDTSSGRIPMNGATVLFHTKEQYKSWENEAMGPWYSQGAAWAVSDNGYNLEPLKGIDLYRDIQPWFGVRYKTSKAWEDTYFSQDDYPVPEPYDTSRSNPAEMRREAVWIDGKNAARQSFKVSQSTRVVDGLWLNYGHHKVSRPNGKPMTAELRDSNDTLLATFTYQAEQALYETTKGDPDAPYNDYVRRAAGKWFYSPISVNGSGSHVTLKEGSTYHLTMKAPTGANYMMLATPSVSLAHSEQIERSLNFWHDGFPARRSTDGGATFPRKVDYTRPHPDGSMGWNGRLGVLFTHPGKPRHMKELE